MRLERYHGLNPSDARHLWLLHLLFLEDINEDCETFQEDWNHKPSSGIHGMSPHVRNVVF